VRSFFATRETETRPSALPPVRVLASEPDVASRRLICALLERESGMMVTSVDDSGDSFARALELLMSYPRSPCCNFLLIRESHLGSFVACKESTDEATNRWPQVQDYKPARDDETGASGSARRLCHSAAAETTPQSRPWL
jgi:hypothetical protein